MRGKATFGTRRRQSLVEQFETSRLAERRPNRIRRSLRTAAIQMSVHADRRLNRLVAKVLLDDRQWHASLNHPGRTGMPQIVHRRRLCQAGLHRTVAARFPASVEELLCANRIARAVREKEARRCEIDDL